jgi:hypothetical protein
MCELDALEVCAVTSSIQDTMLWHTQRRQLYCLMKIALGLKLAS